MAASNSTVLSDFGQAALELDGALTQFEKLAAELDRLAIESDKGMDRAEVLLKEINECRTRMESGMQALSRTLGEARERNQKAEEIIASHSVTIQERQRVAQQMLLRFKMLGDMVRKVDETVSQLRSQQASEPSAEDAVALLKNLPELDNHLGTLVEEARKLAEEAKAANMQALERNADALRKSLASARNRIHLFIERAVPVPPVKGGSGTMIH